jgi:hypothetical protein
MASARMVAKFVDIDTYLKTTAALNFNSGMDVVGEFCNSARNW